MLTQPMMKGMSCPVVLIELIPSMLFHTNINSMLSMNQAILRIVTAFHKKEIRLSGVLCKGVSSLTSVIEHTVKEN